jgi:hypothetical protein
MPTACRPVSIRARIDLMIVGLVLLLTLIASVNARAQVEAGRMVGTVYDATRAVVRGATVVVTNTATNISQTVATRDSGDYVVTPLGPGVYSVSVSAPGFQTLVKAGVHLEVADSVRVDFELSLGAVESQVTVEAATPMLNTESGTLGQVIGNQQVVDLPLNGRGFYELARLTPGAALLPGTGNVLRIRPEFINGTTISGIRGRMITYLLDGFDVTEQHQGGTFIQTSIDDLQEFRVQQNGYSAEYSRAGALLNATTKTGTNSYHGDVFEFLRNDKLDARNFFATSREPLKRNQFGATLGGPLAVPGVYDGRDRVFLFSSYEGTRERQGLVFNSLVPTAAMKRGDFSAAGLPVIYDPLTTRPNPSGTGSIRSPFPGNVIPSNRLSSQALFFDQFIADPNTASGTASFTPTRALDLDQFTVRLDANFNANHKGFVRWSFNDNRQQDPNAFPALGTTPLHTRGQNVAVSVNSVLGSSRVNEFRFSYLPSTIDLQAFGQGRDLNGQAGVRGFEDTRRPGVAGAFPDFAWSGFTSMQGSAFDQRPKTQDRQEYDFSDNLTWIKGRHILKFGTLVRHYQWLGTDSKQFAGSWSFTGINTENPLSPQGTGSSFADWLLGFPASGQRAYPGDVFGGVGTYWHFFAQDDVKVTNKLTLNVGLRYEYSPWLEGYRGQLGTFDPTSSRPIILASGTDQIDIGAQFAAPAAYPLFKDLIQTSHQAGLPINITHNDLGQWAPRFGFAWQPVGERTVVRGGYGIFYEPENTDGRVNLNMVPFKLDETGFNQRGALPQRTFADFFLGQPIGSLTTNPSLNPTPTSLRMGYDQHWNLGIQRQLGGTYLVEVEYVGNKGTFLSSGGPINDPPAGPGSIQQRRPFPRFGSIVFNTQDTSTTYHAIQVSAQKRYSSGFWFLASYTHSKALTHQQTTVAGGDSVFETAPADIDVPNNFAYSFMYELPFGSGKRFLNGASGLAQGVLGGWQIQGILVLRNGLPFTPTVSRDVANIGVGGQRPNRIGSGTLSDPTLTHWFDTSAFTVPDNFAYGNSGRNILRPDPHRDFDFSVFKSFIVREHSRLELRAECFNLTNTPVFSGPNTNIDTAAGGRVTTTANSPRQIQFALKYIF